MPLYNDSVRAEGLSSCKSVQSDTTRVPLSDTTYSLTSSSPHVAIFEGYAVNQRVALPNPATISNGHEFYMANDSTSYVGLYNSAMTSIVLLAPTTRNRLTLKDTTTNTWLIESNSASIGSTASFYGSYGGNAGSGKILEIYPGLDSESAPFIVPINAAIVSVALGSVGTNTGTVGIFKSTNLVNPYYTVSLTAQTSKIVTGLFLSLTAGDSLSMKVTSASAILKPYLTVYISGR